MKLNFLKKSNNWLNDITAGITVSLAMIPEVVAFAFVAQIDPLMALLGAFMVGLVAAVLGGRPGLISGAAGAVAVIFVNLIQIGHQKGLLLPVPIQNMGFYYLFATVILMGIIQIIAGVLKLGKFVKLIPYPVMLGFVNGLAIVIFMSQVKMFSHKVITVGTDNHNVLVSTYMHGMELYEMIGWVLLTMLVIYVLPKLNKKIPAELLAIVITTVLTILFHRDVTTVGSYIIEGGGTGLKGHFPTFNQSLWNYLPLNIDTLSFIAPYAFLAAAVGIIESLMTMNLVDDMTDSRGNGNRECIAQGVGNITSGLFGGTGGCGMIGQTLININAKGRGRLSGIMMALTLLFFILFVDQYIEQVPIAALVGVMFMMVIHTFAWSSFRIIKKIPKSDAFILVAVSLITVFFDLAIAVFLGVIIAALVFAWENAIRIRARRRLKDGKCVYEIWGPLFFGSVSVFNDKFDVKNDPEGIEIDFIESRVSDQSGLEAIKAIVLKYEQAGKKVFLRHLSNDCKKLLLKADPKFAEIIIEDIDDPRYYLVASPEKYTKGLYDEN